MKPKPKSNKTSLIKYNKLTTPIPKYAGSQYYDEFHQITIILWGGENGPTPFNLSINVYLPQEAGGYSLKCVSFFQAPCFLVDCSSQTPVRKLLDLPSTASTSRLYSSPWSFTHYTYFLISIFSFLNDSLGVYSCPYLLPFTFYYSLPQLFPPKKVSNKLFLLTSI